MKLSAIEELLLISVLADRERLNAALAKTEELIVKAARFLGEHPNNTELRRRFVELVSSRNFNEANKVGVGEK